MIAEEAGRFGAHLPVAVGEVVPRRRPGERRQIGERHTGRGDREERREERSAHARVLSRRVQMIAARQKRRAVARTNDARPRRKIVISSVATMSVGTAR